MTTKSKNYYCSKQENNWKLIDWAMSDNEERIDSWLGGLRDEGKIVKKRILKDRLYKFGIYQQDIEVGLIEKFMCWDCKDKWLSEIGKQKWMTREELIKRVEDDGHIDFCCPRCSSVIICCHKINDGVKK